MSERKSGTTSKLFSPEGAMTIFGRNIREARKQRGLSQAKLSRISGVNISIISTIELGRGGNPDFELALMLAVGLGISMPSLFSGVGFRTTGAESEFEPVQIGREARRRGQRGALVRAISQAVPS